MEQDLVIDPEGWLVAAERQDLAGELGDLLGGFRLVDDPKHDLRLLQLLEGALDAEALFLGVIKISRQCFLFFCHNNILTLL